MPLCYAVFTRHKSYLTKIVVYIFFSLNFLPFSVVIYHNPYIYILLFRSVFSSLLLLLFKPFIHVLTNSGIFLVLLPDLSFIYYYYLYFTFLPFSSLIIFDFNNSSSSSCSCIRLHSPLRTHLTFFLLCLTT